MVSKIKSKISKIATTMAHESTKMGQDDSKMAQDSPKMGEDRPMPKTCTNFGLILVFDKNHCKCSISFLQIVEVLKCLLGAIVILGRPSSQEFWSKTTIKPIRDACRLFSTLELLMALLGPSWRV